MARRSSYIRPALTVFIAVIVVLLALPQSWKTWAPGFISAPKLHLGLDLAGGTQLDFRISEEEIAAQLKSINAEIAEAQKNNRPKEEIDILKAQKASIEEQQSNIVEAIRTVIERRVNGLGVSEAVITPSYIGNEKHLLVECPGVVDVQECIKVVGKTIQLEFKEEFTSPTEDFTQEVRANVAQTVARLTKSGSTLEKEGQNLSSQLGVTYADSRTLFRDQLPAGLESLWNMPAGKWIQKEGLVDCQNANAMSPQFIQQFCIDANGQFAANKISGIFLAAPLRPLTATGRVINEAPKAFALLAKTETGTSYVYHSDLVLDEKVDPAITSALRDMQAGQLRAIPVGNTARVAFLRQFTPGGEQMSASHILVSFKGAAGAEPGVTRTKEEAMAKANQLKAQLDKGANFAALARRESDGPSKAQGGYLGTFGHNVMAPSFEKVAFGLKQGEISSVVETQFGYHIIRADTAAAISPAHADVDMLTITGPDAATRAQALVTKLQNGEVRSTEEAITIRHLFFSLAPTGWKDTELDGKHFRHAAVTLDPVTNIPVVQISFDTEGGKLFQQITKNNIGKKIAIFVGGQMVTSPTVNEEISGGIAVITGSRTVQEARTLAQDLNTGAIPAPIYLTGQYTIEATLGSSALQTSLLAGFIGVIILMIYMLVVYRMLGAVANVALMVYAFILFASLKLPLFLISHTYVVLTLAGMAGIILSVGMAVDANVLVFERMKEELRKGKSLRNSIDSSFKYAWPAIRDGNVSTIITCLILFSVGTSIIRGFAVTLGVGVLLSMFSAIIVTKWLLRRLAEIPGFDKPELYGVRVKPDAK